MTTSVLDGIAGSARPAQAAAQGARRRQRGQGAPTSTRCGPCRGCPTPSPRRSTPSSTPPRRCQAAGVGIRIRGRSTADGHCSRGGATAPDDPGRRYARGLVDRRLHRRRRPGVRRADPAAGGRGAGRCRRVSSTSGAATGRSAGSRRRRRRRARPSASTRRGTRSASPRHARRRDRLRPRRRRRLPFPTARSTPSSPASSSSTSTTSTTAIAEVARVLDPGGRFCFFLNHPLLQTPNSGWIDDQVLDPPEQYWRIGPYLAGGGDDRGGRARRAHPLHPPPAVAIREHARRAAACCSPDGRAGAAGRVPRPRRGVRRRGDGPRLLYLRTSNAREPAASRATAAR